MDEVSKLLKATNFAPSAGDVHPLSIYFVASDIETLDCGVYSSIVEPIFLENIQEKLFGAGLRQDALKAPIVFVIAVNYEKIMRRYGRRGIRYGHLEAGHVAQNILLRSVDLNLGSVVIGAFKDLEVKALLKIQDDPLYLIPVGHI
jgi:SagB-type dehydrogenase family enzyme